MTTLEAANAAMRKAVETRLATGTYDEFVETPQRFYGHEGEPRGPSAAEVIERFNTTPQALPKGAEEWRMLHREMFDLHVLKTRQYGREDSAFANVEASALCGVEPWRRALCDLSDCVVRMQRYANGQPVDYENALKDAAMWAMICLVQLRRERQQ